MITIDQLQANRELLWKEWMKRVEFAKAAGLTAREFRGAGPILAKDTSLLIQATVFGERTFDLRVMPDGTFLVENAG